MQMADIWTKMRWTQVGLVVVVVLVWATLAGARDPAGYDGHGLYNDCTAALRVFNAKLEDPLSLNTLVLCLNYLRGFIDGYGLHTTGDICFTKGMSTIGVARAVVKWLDINEAWRDLPRADVMHAALTGAYPCPSPAAPSQVPSPAGAPAAPKSKTQKSR
jgi:Ssp1 endopeptidase immunity protein Rap1a